MATWKEHDEQGAESKAVLKISCHRFPFGDVITPAGQDDLVSSISLLHQCKLREIPALHYMDKSDHPDIQFDVYGDLNGTKLKLASVSRQKETYPHGEPGPAVVIYYSGWAMRLLDGLGYLSQSLGICLKDPDFWLMAGAPPEHPIVICPFVDDLAELIGNGN